MNAPVRLPLELPDRLQGYARYMVVVAEQLEALRSRDSDRFGELRRERADIESRLGDAAGGGNEFALSLGIQEALITGIEALEADSGSDDLQQERLRELTSGALKVARRLRAHTQYRYGGRYPDLAAPAAHLDRRM